MKELKGWPFEPLDGIHPNGIGDGVGPGDPGQPISHKPTDYT